MVVQEQQNMERNKNISTDPSVILIQLSIDEILDLNFRKN